MKRKMLQIIFTLFVLYAAALAALYFGQRGMLFLPDRTRPSPALFGHPGLQVVHAVTRDGLTLEGWYSPPRAPGLPVLVWFHGNAGHHGWRAALADPYVEAGYGLLLASYRGYGGNPGRPSEQGFYADARAWLAALMETGVPPGDIVLYGESIGTGVAVQMAVEFPDMRALVLQSPYTSLPDVAKSRYGIFPVDALMKDQFRSIDKIAHVKMPLLVVQGLRDDIVPSALGQKLYAAARVSKDLVTYDAYGHNDMPPVPVAVRVMEFLDRHHTERP